MSQPCASCRATESIFVLDKPDDSRRDGTIELRRCLRCGTVFLGIEVDEDFDEDLYAYYLKRLDWPREQLFDQITERRLEALLAKLGRELDLRGGGRRVLDVGCGMGQFVSSAFQRGWQPMGLELAPGAVAIAQRLGLPVRKLDFFSPELEPRSWDLLTMFEVIEHVPAPGAFLTRAEELLRPGGLLCLTTPNFACLDRRVLGRDWDAIHREHVTYFTPGTLSALVSRSGRLRIVELETRNVSLAALRSLLPRVGLKKPATSAAVDRNLKAANERALRVRVEGSFAARMLKSLANRALDLGHLGSTTVMLLERSY